MMGDGYGNSSCGGVRGKKKKMTKKSRGRKRTLLEQLVAWRAVQVWAFPETQAAAGAAAPAAADEFLPSAARAPKEDGVVFELHSHFPLEVQRRVPDADRACGDGAPERGESSCLN